jgi:hypothetical protein
VQGLSSLVIDQPQTYGEDDDSGDVISMTRKAGLEFDPAKTSIDLYWIPLGAGGAGLVRFNGWVYEAIKARGERRRPLDLYHTALEVRVPEGASPSRTRGPVPIVTLNLGASSSKVLLATAGSPVSGCSATRFAAGRTASFRTQARRWKVRRH